MMQKLGSVPSRWLMFAAVLVGLVGCNSPGPARQETGSRTGGSTSRAPDWEVSDLRGRPVNPLAASRAKAVNLIFVRTDCPISNHYAPEIERLYEKFHPAGVAFWLVYPEDGTPTAEIQRHDRDYGLSLPVLRDPEHRLVRKLGVRVTPEAALLHLDGTMIYRGRIDDQYVDFGKQRSQATHHDLEAALAQVVTGKPVTNAETIAIGCYISGLQ